jgi:TPR repeat protein
MSTNTYTATTTEAVLAPIIIMLPKLNFSLSKRAGEVVSFKTISRPVTIALMMLGVVLIPLGIAAFISWLVFCFGSIIIGLLLLFLFPVGLAFPLIITQFGWELIVKGFYNLDYIKEGQNNDPYFELWEKEKENSEDYFYEKYENEGPWQRDLTEVKEVADASNEEIEKIKKQDEKDKADPTVMQLSEIYNTAPLYLLVECMASGIEKYSVDDTVSANERKKLLRHLLNNNNATAQVFQGYTYYRDKEYKKAFNLWSKASRQESALTKPMQETLNQNIGMAYYLGNGVTHDYKKAGEWFIKSAKIGGDNAQHSQYNLSIMYLNGEGVEKNISEARYWAKEACIGANSKVTNLAEKLCDQQGWL